MSQFDSRNNDIAGYWAVGQLLAGLGPRSELTLDLLAHTSNPPGGLAGLLASRFGVKLSDLLSRRGLEPSWLSASKFAIRFGEDGDDDDTAYQLSVELSDDRGQVWTAAREGRCRPHSGQRERRRGEADRTPPL